MLRSLTGGRDLARIGADETALADDVCDGVFWAWHARVTCRMGDPADPGAVVDPTGSTIKTDGLTVADASVMPRLPSANTNVPTLMIAKKIADDIRAG